MVALLLLLQIGAVGTFRAQAPAPAGSKAGPTVKPGPRPVKPAKPPNAAKPVKAVKPSNPAKPGGPQPAVSSKPDAVSFVLERCSIPVSFGPLVATPPQRLAGLSCQTASPKAETKQLSLNLEPSLATCADPKDAPPNTIKDCDLLRSLTPPTAQTVVSDAMAGTSKIGDQYTLFPAGPSTIIVEGTTDPAKMKDADWDDVRRLNALLNSFVIPGLASFSVELKIPHAGALNGVVARLSALNYSQFTIVPVGADRVRITGTNGPPSAKVWMAFLDDVRHVVQGISPEPPVYKLFYTQSSDAMALLAPNQGSSSPAAAAPSVASAAGAAPVVQPQAAAGAQAATAAISATSASPIEVDTLAFSDNLGDDAAVMERKRILAAIDLPRPEMIINAWVIQNSTKDGKKDMQMHDLVHGLVIQHNDVIQNALLRGWSYVKNRMAVPSNYFDKPFYEYLTERVVFNPAAISKDDANADGADATAKKSQMFLSYADAQSSLQNLDRYGICRSDEYCLGYRTLFQPMKPSFMSLLLGLIAAKDPVCEVGRAVDAVEMENPPAPDAGDCTLETVNANPPAEFKRKPLEAENKALLKNIEALLSIEPEGNPTIEENPSCEDNDRIRILDSLVEKPGPFAVTPRLPLECFRQVAARTFDSKLGAAPNGIDLLRASIADFLFHYKMSQAYPHEFVPYDLSMSADAFNTAMSPLVEAFNRDLRVFEDYLRARIDAEVGAAHLVSRKNDFFNSGTVSLSTLSGYASSVSTNSTSFLDASQAPTPNALLSSIMGAAPASSTATGTTTTGTTTPTTGVLGSLSGGQAQVLAGALQAYQSQQMQVSRSLSLNFTPRSLIGASASELVVTLNADEPAAPSYFPTTPGGTSTPADSSYVANHDMTTHVRVDSIKLFEVSAFSAILQNGHRVFPLLPPFLTLPYIGTFAGIPLPPAKQYHSSTAILEATVVPTATDLAYSLRYVVDAIVDENKTCAWPTLDASASTNATKACTIHRALSLTDFGNEPIREFHRMKVQCFATGGRSATPTDQNPTQLVDPVCANLSFQNVFHQSN